MSLREFQVAVLGGGSWGTTVASLAAANAASVLWVRDEEIATAICKEHRNPRYLGDLPLHEGLRATADLEEAVWDADVIISAVPTKATRRTMEDLATLVRHWVPIVSASKGFEAGTGLRTTQVIEEVLPGHPLGVLSGPNLAREVLAGFAAGSVVAMPDDHLAASIAAVFGSPSFRVYTSTDVIGCELGGALKNVVAIGVGVAEGLSIGDNTRAMVFTRGLAEMTRLGVAMGGEPQSFAGLTGVGDLMATCMSPLSRNRSVGVELGRGRSIDEVLAGMDQVAEGVRSAPTVAALADEHGVFMPIARGVARIVAGEITPLEAAAAFGQLPTGPE